MSMPKILVGCDPELFVRNTETGKFVAPYQMIPGDKHAPHPVPDGAIQVDGMAVEFNIEPAQSKDEWLGKIAGVRASLKAAIPEGHELVVVPTADFDPDYWDTLPKEALEIGCVPDFNVYTGQENPRPDPKGQFFRSAAGHVHIGWTKDKAIDDVDHIADCVEVAKQLDFYLGIPSGLWDREQRRRQLYGKAGSIRVKSYGLEYRTPSNMWLTNTALTGFVYDATIAAVTDLFEGVALRTKFNEGWAQQYINGLRTPTTDTMYAIGQYSNRLVKCGIYDLMKHVPPKEKPKVKVQPFPEAVDPLENFMWRGRNIKEADLDEVDAAIRFVQRDRPDMGQFGVLPALMGLRQNLRNRPRPQARVAIDLEAGGWNAAPQPVRVPPNGFVVRGRDAGVVVVDDFADAAVVAQDAMRRG